MKKKLKDKTIAFVINDLSVGGAAKVMKWLSNESVNIFGKTVIISLSNLDHKITGFEKEIQIYDLELLNNQTKGYFNRIRKINKLKKILKKIQPDLICSFVSDVNVTTYFASRKLDIPIILSDHGNPKVLNFIWKYLTKYVYKRASSSVFLTQETLDYFNSPDNSHVIENPYISPNIERHEGIRNKTICSAGRFVLEKNYHLLVEAFAEVLEEYPEYELIIYGDGPERNSLEKLIKEKELEEKVLLPGYVNNIPKHIYKNSIFVLSSNNEGFPVVLIEAMGVGVPTVSTNCGGTKEITSNGERGLLIKTNNKNEMVFAIKKILENKELSNKLSKKGLEIREELSPTKIFAKWKKVFIYNLKQKTKRNKIK